MRAALPPIARHRAADDRIARPPARAFRHPHRWAATAVLTRQRARNPGAHGHSRKADRPRRPARTAALLVLLGGIGGAWAGELTRDRQAETGLVRWHYAAGALDLTLVQRLPDQTRAFFMARGFDAEAVERIAGACVFQAIVRNREPGGDTTLELDLQRWRVATTGAPLPLPVREQWQQTWRPTEVPQAARLALHWALFPTRQQFGPGDYNWGMITFGPEPGTVFDLYLQWREGPRLGQGLIVGLVCAEQPTPGSP